MLIGFGNLPVFRHKSLSSKTQRLTWSRNSHLNIRNVSWRCEIQAIPLLRKSNQNPNDFPREMKTFDSPFPHQIQPKSSSLSRMLLHNCSRQCHKLRHIR